MTLVLTMRPSRRAPLALAVCLSFAPLNGLVASAAAGPFGFFDAPIMEEERAPPPQPRKPRKSKPRADKMALKPEAVPAGPLQIVVSIARQRATLFSDTVRIAEAPISTGVAGHPTPMGVFSVIAKSRHHKSNIYSGAPMPYMQRITWSGIALHQGPLPGFPASHGCVRLPEAFAAKLWTLTKLETRVVITRDEAAPVAIASPRLLNPKPPAAPMPELVAPAAPPAAPDTVASITELAAAPVKQAEPSAAPPAAATVPVAQKPKPKRPVQVFVSRKEGKLYVRQSFEPLFDMPLTIAEPDKPWGTHVFTVTGIKDETASWVALTIPSGYAGKTDPAQRKISARERERLARRAADLAQAPTAAEALTRFDLPPEAVERIAPLLGVGSALIVSDNALSDETGLETGFVVLTH